MKFNVRKFVLLFSSLSLFAVAATCDDGGGGTAAGGSQGAAGSGGTASGGNSATGGGAPTSDASAVDAPVDAPADPPRDAAVVVDVIDIVLPPECEPPPLKLTKVAMANEPMAMVQPKGDDRFFVAERRGLIRILKNGAFLPAPFADLRTSIAAYSGAGMGQGERGLTNLAFHPDFATNGRFYVFYTRSANDPFSVGTIYDGDVVVAEGKRSAADPDKAEVGLTPLHTVQHDGVNGRRGCCDDGHNGGFLGFARDGFLYAAVGDGGGAANTYGGEAPGLSKILRLDVDNPKVPPAGNIVADGITPFAWAVGVRNPWRGTFDPKTGDMYFGDVGEGMWEEINYVPAGQVAPGLNFGWDNPGGNRNIEMEGTHLSSYFPYTEVDGGVPYGVMPVHQYEHPVDPNSFRGDRMSRAIVGGVVYRGTAINKADGRYFFGDYPSNQVWSMLVIGGRSYCHINHTAELVSAQTPLQGLTGFGQGNNGEIHLHDIFGNIYLLGKK